jgi:alkylated DNA nucleotide flippase Atl1
VSSVDGAYVEAVLSLVERVPPGRVTTYGALARAVGTGGPRQVGRVMALHGDAVPWWRVVHADGRPATCHDGTALAHLREEGVPLTNGPRVDMASYDVSWEGSGEVGPGVTGSSSGGARGEDPTGRAR